MLYSKATVLYFSEPSLFSLLHLSVREKRMITEYNNDKYISTTERHLNRIARSEETGFLLCRQLYRGFVKTLKKHGTFWTSDYFRNNSIPVWFINAFTMCTALLKSLKVQQVPFCKRGWEEKRVFRAQIFHFEDYMRCRPPFSTGSHCHL